MGVGQEVPHAGEVVPRDARLGREQASREVLDGHGLGEVVKRTARTWRSAALRRLFETTRRCSASTSCPR